MANSLPTEPEFHELEETKRTPFTLDNIDYDLVYFNDETMDIEHDGYGIGEADLYFMLDVVEFLGLDLDENDLNNTFEGIEITEDEEC